MLKKVSEVKNDVIDALGTLDVFNYDDLGPAIAELMTIMEGEDYSYYEAKITFTIRCSDTSGDNYWDEEGTSYSKIISKSAEKKVCMRKWEENFSTIIYLTKDCQGSYYDFMGHVYDMNCFANLNLALANFNKITENQKRYVIDFIDYLIDFRAKNQSIQLSRIIIFEVLSEFLKTYKDLKNPSLEVKKFVKE